MPHWNLRVCRVLTFHSGHNSQSSPKYIKINACYKALPKHPVPTCSPQNREKPIPVLLNPHQIFFLGRTQFCPLSLFFLILIFWNTLPNQSLLLSRCCQLQAEITPPFLAECTNSEQARKQNRQGIVSLVYKISRNWRFNSHWRIWKPSTPLGWWHHVKGRAEYLKKFKFLVP